MDNLTEKEKEQQYAVRRKKTGNTVTVQAKKKTAKKKKKGVLKKIGSGLKKTAGAVLLAPLLPFKPAMIRELKKQGHYTKGMTLKEVAYGFYTYVISKKGDKTSQFEPIDYSEFMNNAAFHYSVEDAASDNQIGAAAATVATIVQAIIERFKAAKERRQAAKQAGVSEKEYKANTKEEDVRMGEAAEQVETELEEKAAGEKEVKQVDLKKYIIYAVVIAAIITVIYFVTKKK